VSDWAHRVSESEEGERLDVLVARSAAITRTFAQWLIKRGHITSEGRALKASTRVETGWSLAGEIPERDIAPPEAEDIPIDVRYDDERVMVVSKPPGLVTHPASGHRGSTLVNALLALDEPLAGRGTSLRPGIVHRLDRDTSGLLLIAKDDGSREHLVSALRERAVERRYLALVRSPLPSPSGTIEAPIGRHPTKRTMMGVVPGGRPSVTHYSLRDSTEDVSLLDVRLETGRTHQIRVHLAHLRHPVLGDRTYGGMNELARRLELDRPFLHAYRIVFPHPEGGRLIEVEEGLPPDLASVLHRAGLQEHS
jgi:23S rRNA pseudouridine1911/1915/1917 synthase